MENWNCPKHGSTDFGFAFLCEHLLTGSGVGFNVAEDDEKDEPRPPALCDDCEEKSRAGGGHRISRICGVCYHEIRQQNSRR